MTGSGYNKYAAGKKRYGSGLLDVPNIGPSDKMGYKVRDAKNRARKDAMVDVNTIIRPDDNTQVIANKKRNQQLKKMKAAQRGAFSSADYLGK